ncbi:hypothetical protein SPRG_10517 [Saprolegnia parasitica CBS 223.65]|uniref:BAR domain-containing protein n=1 Tax=Saprolegnia parasitica (strain CBS 223.65) TaxID=695850 RepID=A0A067BZ12_SAPPC|nr:hypothetical protein SPRG_10517 [Saprolegnia parasitica CBS 223.65]KDO23739.1 hypothetical protein SPRG_10517 [Saprolegnia parasitica CBS 223.65]|eukprot:XP_012205557.1 hypothetical protein SPRG_10517 [Saprolegnia parasitica CBS 223.65]
MASWMRSGLQNVVDGSRRLKEEILQNAGVYGAGYSDPVLEARTQRYAQHSVAIDRLHAATTTYIKQLDALSAASTSLAHEFKSYFNMQLSQSTGQDDASDGLVGQLARASDCLETLHWTLKQHVVDASASMLSEKVLKPLGKLKQDAAATQKTIQLRKQKILDFDALRRSTGTSRPSAEAQTRLRTSEEAVVAVTTQLNTALDALEAQRGYLLRTELLALSASHVFVSSKSAEAFQQLIPLMPGMAFRLTELSAKSAGLVDPTAGPVLGILDYAGPDAVLSSPVNAMNLLDLPTTDVPRLNDQDPFERMHCAQQLAQETYQAAPEATRDATPTTSSNPVDAFDVGLQWMS